MEIISSTVDGGLNRYMRRRRYQRLDGTYRKKMKVIRIGGSPKRFWKIRSRAATRLRLRMCSMLMFWRKLKNAYADMMLRLCGQYDSGNYVLSGRRIPKARKATIKYTSDEFHDRIVYEIYKNLMPSRELATI